MRVLLADKLPDQARVRLAASGCEVRVEPNISGDGLLTLLGEFDPEVLVVRSTKVQARHLEAAANLALIVRAGAGVDNIDTDFAASRGVYVSNCPGKNAVAVAELTFALLLGLDRFLPDNVRDLREGTWNKAAYSKGRGLHGRVIGLLGFGDIGREVAHRAQAFGMEVIAWSRSLTEDKAALYGIRRYATPQEVAVRADVLSVHLAETPETRGIVGESILGAMKPGAVFLNTSRAGVVDAEALLRVLDGRGVRAGLDVFPDEPAGGTGTIADALASHPSVYGTHHIGASTEQAQLAVAEEACRIVEAYKQSGQVPNCVNLATRSEADHVLVVRHRDRVGVLAAVLEALRAGDHNIQEMGNLIFEGGEAAVARIHLHGQPGPTTLERIRSHPDIFSASAVPLGRGGR